MKLKNANNSSKEQGQEKKDSLPKIAEAIKVEAHLTESELGQRLQNWLRFSKSLEGKRYPYVVKLLRSVGFNCTGVYKGPDRVRYSHNGISLLITVGEAEIWSR